MGRQVLTIKADIANNKNLISMINKTIKFFGRIDILVNNGAILFNDDIFSLSENKFDRMIEVNIKGVFNCSKLVSKHMIDNKYGKIINISSIASLGISHTIASGYAITKASINILTKQFALELGKNNINVNAIAPGLVVTDMAKTLIPTQKFDSTLDSITLDSIAQTSALKRVGDPQDIANLALFLASDESSFITGQIITIDGGRTDLFSYSA